MHNIISLYKYFMLFYNKILDFPKFKIIFIQPVFKINVLYKESYVNLRLFIPFISIVK